LAEDWHLFQLGFAVYLEFADGLQLKLLFIMQDYSLGRWHEDDFMRNPAKGKTPGHRDILKYTGFQI